MFLLIQVATILVSVLGVLFSVVSQSTNNWYEQSSQYYIASTTLERNYGLWKNCGSYSSNCYTYGDDLIITKICTVIAVLAYAFGLLGVLMAFMKRSYVLVSAMSFVVAALFQLIGMIMFHHSLPRMNTSLGWSGKLGWAVLVFSIMSSSGAIVLNFLRSREVSENDDMERIFNKIKSQFTDSQTS